MAVAATSENASKETVQQYEEDASEDKSFEELGVDARLVRALLKKGIDKPTPIQSVAIPLILVTLQFPHSNITINPITVS